MANTQSKQIRSEMAESDSASGNEYGSRSDRKTSSHKRWWKGKWQAVRDEDLTAEKLEDEGVFKLFGMRQEIQELHRESEDDPWDEWIPESIPRYVEEGDEAEEYAIITRYQRKQETGGLVLHSLVVQSPLLRDVLDSVFEDYQGLSTKLTRLEFHAPFHEFYYRWHLFEEAYKRNQKATTREHLELLYPIISREILPHIETMRDLTRNNLITYEYLWTIFAPDSDIYVSIDGPDQIYHLKDSFYDIEYSERPAFHLNCRYIDCDGKQFGYIDTTLWISYFTGVKTITDLEAYPSHLHPDPEKLLERLHARGKKFQKLNGFNHVAYSGFYIDQTRSRDREDREDREKRYVVDGRVIIDPEMFAVYRCGRWDKIKPLSENELSGHSNDESSACKPDTVIQRATWKAFVEFEKFMRKFQTENLDNSPCSLNPRQMLHITPMAKGFCLASKKWAEFYVDNIEPIEWNLASFNALVLPNGYKEIMLAFVQEQLSGDCSFDDIFNSKGKGFVMLLSGEPGVGKTLTAESVAEAMQRPLYSLSAGELGETTSRVEEELERVLELTAHWRAVLLIDECDIFLEQRTTSDITRNRLVSIFLKQLEYNRSLMLLTSNRATVIDPAFESRIHLAINYPSLDYESRHHIWTTCVKLSVGSDPANGTGQVTVSEEEVGELARCELNGRQIKNVVKTALLLARNEQVPLAKRHIEKVLEVKASNSLSAVMRAG